MKHFRHDKKGLGTLVMVVVVVVVLLMIGAGALYLAYSSNKFPGCVFVKGTTESNTAGVIDANILVTRHYNYMAQTNTLIIEDGSGTAKAISNSEMAGYTQSFSDYVSGIMPAQAISTAMVGSYTFNVMKGGVAVYSTSGVLNFEDHGVNQGGDVSDIRATITLPVLFLAKGTYVITMGATLGDLTTQRSVNFAC